MASPDSGKEALFKIFYHFYCLSDQVSKDRIPRRNDFSNIQQYFVQCELPSALAKIRMSSGTGSPGRTNRKKLVLDRLKNPEKEWRHKKFQNSFKI